VPAVTKVVKELGDLTREAGLSVRIHEMKSILIIFDFIRHHTVNRQ
jgi:hypothetical protein